LPAAKYHLLPFVLPADSGFALQLAAAKKKSHWISPSGADMVRFYLASLFPKVTNARRPQAHPHSHSLPSVMWGASCRQGGRCGVVPGLFLVPL
jgi:hypothetical protein